MRALAFSILFAACGTPAQHPQSSDVPAAIRAEALSGAEVRRFDAFDLPGLELWLLGWAVPDQSTSTVVGLDAQGHVVRGWDLIARSRASGAEPAALARHVLAFLMGMAGHDALEPPLPEATIGYTAEEAAAARAPALEGDRLVFWVVIGEMAPRLTRVIVSFEAQEIDRTSVDAVLHPPPDPLDTLRAADGADALLAALGEIASLAQTDPRFQRRADEAVAPVTPSLTHTDPRVRRLAIEVLGYLRSPLGVALLVPVMRRSEDSIERIFAAMSLLKIDTPDAVAAVRAYERVAPFNDRITIREHLRVYDAGH